MTGYPFTCPIQVRYVDLDAMNHVNNAVYVTYLEVARAQLLRTRLGFRSSASEFPIILARVAVDYRAPIALEDSVEVGIAVSRIGTSSFTLAYRVEASGRLAAEAETVIVWFDYSAGHPVPIPDQARAELESLRTERQPTSEED